MKKEIETSYIELKNELIKTLSEKQDEDNKLIHLHGEFGTGKSVLMQSVIREIKNKNDVVLIDEYLYSNDDIEAALNKIKRRRAKIIPLQQEIDYLSNKKKIISFFMWIIGATIALLGTYLTIKYSDASKNIAGLYWICIIPMIIFASSIFIVPDFRKVILKQVLFKAWIRKKNRIYIFENIDRNEWDQIIFLFKEVSRKVNGKVIFTYSMENLAERYKEKYGAKDNLYLSLEKFINKEFILSDYSKAISTKIVRDIFAYYGLDDIVKIDSNVIKNFRLVDRVAKYLSDRQKIIKTYELDQELVFYLYYLKISDNIGYKYVEHNFTRFSARNNHSYLTENDLGWWKSNYSNNEKMEEKPVDVLSSEVLIRKIITLFYNKGQKASLHFISTADQKIFEKIETAKETLSSDEYITTLDDIGCERFFFNIELARLWDLLSINVKMKFINRIFETINSLDEAFAIIRKIDLHSLTIFELRRLGIQYFDFISSKTIFNELNSYEQWPLFHFASIVKHLNNVDLKIIKQQRDDEVVSNWKNISEKSINKMTEIIGVFNKKMKEWKFSVSGLPTDEINSWDAIEIMILKREVKIDDLDDLNKWIKNPLPTFEAISIRMFHALFSQDKRNYKDDIRLANEYGELEIKISAIKKQKDFEKILDEWKTLVNDFKSSILNHVKKEF